MQELTNLSWNVFNLCKSFVQILGFEVTIHVKYELALIIFVRTGFLWICIYPAVALG